MKSRNLNAAQFADEIGVQRSSVSHILTGRNNASLDFLLKVLSRYPEIDTDWLLTGKGVMVRSTSVNSGNTNETRRNESIKAISIPADQEIPVDLFRSPLHFSGSNQEIEVKNREVAPKEEDQKGIDNEEQNKKPGEMAMKPISTRQIDKIVIFYSDKTFTEYKPEN